MLCAFPCVRGVFWFLLRNTHVDSWPISLLAVGFLLPADLEQHLAIRKLECLPCVCVFFSLDFSCFFHAGFALTIMLSYSFWLYEF